MNFAQALQAAETDIADEQNMLVFSKFVMDTLKYIPEKQLTAPWERIIVTSNPGQVKLILIHQGVLIRFFLINEYDLEDMIKYHKKNKQRWTSISCLKWSMNTGWITPDDQIHCVTLNRGLDRTEEVEEVLNEMLGQVDHIRSLAENGDLL